MLRIITTVLITIATLSCSAQTVCEKLEQLKKECYGFKPKTLTDIQRQAKSAQLDKFWNFVKENKAESAECLKGMILSENNDSYFCFDASSLLLEIDEKLQYLDVVAEGLKKCNLEDLQLEPYLRISFFLGVKGKDISPLAEKLISYPNAKVFLTVHVITLNAVDASLFLYNIMGTEKAEKNLFDAILKGNQTAKHNAAIILNLISTHRGDSLINNLIQNKQLSDSTIKFIENDRKQFINKASCNSNINKDEVIQRLNAFPPAPGAGYGGFAGNKDLLCAAINVLTADDMNLIRNARQKSTPGLSDESLYEYFALTAIIMTIRNK